MSIFSGQKTYIVGAAMVLYGLSGGLLGEVDSSVAIELILQGMAIIALRLGIAKES